MNRALLDADVRILSAALIANQAVVRPHLITATGRAAPSQFVIVPPGVSAKFALMPGVDYDDDLPALRPGGGFVGGRISRFAPFMDAQTVATLGPLQVTLREIPADRDAILRELRTSAGLAWAPGSLYALVGWEDEWVAAWADRLRDNGLEARLIIAHAQAMLALRKMWLAVVWDVHGRRVAGHLAATSGAAAVARALVDVLAVVERIRFAASADGAVTNHTGESMARLVNALRSIVRHLKAADRHGSPEIIRKKLRTVVDKTKIALHAIGKFSIGPETVRQRWYRLNAALKEMPRGDHERSLTPILDGAIFEIERLSCAVVGGRLEATGWRPHIRRALHRLGESDPTIRMARLERIRGDLIYQLAITGRLERLYDLFPWLAAHHGAFPGCAGGAMGALASLLESGRAVQLARELRRELRLPTTGSAARNRLTFSAMRGTLASSTSIFVAVNRGHAAGAELVRQGISHATVQSALAGSLFGPHAVLTHAQQARLGWNDSAAFRENARTVSAAEAITDSLPFERHDHDGDVPRHVGMTSLRLINAAIASIFPTMALEPHRKQAEAAAHKAGRPASSGMTPEIARIAMQNAMLASVERDPSPRDRRRDGMADDTVPDDEVFSEILRAEGLQSNPTPKSAAYDEHDDGQGRRRMALHEPVNSDPRGKLLRELVEETRRWREPYKGREYTPPRDDMLEDLLRGNASHLLTQPVSDLFVPVLWFAPYIDRKLLGWIGSGAPAADGWGKYHEAVSAEVGRAHAWAPSLFAHPFVVGRDDLIACQMFTGRSPPTWDLGHAR